MQPNRRRFLKQAALAGAGACLVGQSSWAKDANDNGLHLATNQYPWITFYRRQGVDYGAQRDQAMGEMAAAGLDGLEPIANSPADVDRLAPLLKKHGLEMRSLYVNSTLHKKDAVDESLASVLAIAERAKAVGTKIIVTNPSPVGWGSDQAKSDAELTLQANALEKLGRGLRDLGLMLSYHNHDMELKHAAREFHHMLAGTDPEAVTFCLDAHWVYRGAGNSQVALFDVIRLYGSRITELHLRQSKDHVWTEAFGPGDIDYVRLAKEVAALGIKPHLVLEQAVEGDSPNELDAKTAHTQGAQYARQVFAAFA